MARIIYFTRDYTTHDHRFVTALAKTEHKVYYLRLERGAHQLEDRALPAEVEIVNWAGGRNLARLLDGPSLLASLKRLIRQIKPDLIQAGPIQRTAFLAALSGFHPLISMSWGYDLIHDAQRNIFWEWATRYTLRRSDLLVGDCNTIRQLANSYGMPDERIVTFPWGVDIRHFTPLPAGEDSSAEAREGSTFTLLSTRGWEPIYGVDVIARAFVQAAQQHPELQLIMLGNGSQAGLLHNIFERAGLRERVFFLGQVSQAELPRLYGMADLYISASHSDGTSISLLEAMACGKPVLVSDIPGNQEWVTAGENGWLFPDGDSRSLAEAISHAMTHRARLPEMGRAARRLAEARADWEKNFQILLEAYELVFAEPLPGQQSQPANTSI
ncbi:MAG TPA: glycosyltransferase family 4 protein [Anaerolineales bacterium]|nr:glycosyltransferase family 4 protein [Anaerolineales bacterium]